MKLRIVIWLVFLLFGTRLYSQNRQHHYVASSKDIPLREYIIENNTTTRSAYLVTDSLATDTIVMIVTIHYTPVDTLDGAYKKSCDIRMFERSHVKRRSMQDIMCPNDTTIDVYYTRGNPDMTFKSIQAREVKNIFELVSGIKTTDLGLLKTVPHFPTDLIYIQFEYCIIPQ